MDNAQQHWPILERLGTDLANRVRSFMVIGYGNGVIVATEDGEGYWLGQMKLSWNKSKTATKPTLLKVPNLIHMVHGFNYIVMLNKQGEIYSMGENDRGQLGLGNVKRKTYLSPRLISIIPHTKFISVRCGGGHSLALTEDGKCWAWGGNYSGQVGMPKSTRILPSPRQIPELDPHRIVAVECGRSQSLALTDQGEVYAWGGNGCGELGYRSYSSTHIPTQIPIPSPVQSMAAGSNHTLLLTQTGEVWACGWNGGGQLGFPTSLTSNTCFSKVENLPPISQIASHFATDLSIAMSSDQRCFVWGQLCDGTSIYIPRELPSIYSTVESPLSSFSTIRSTPHSVSFPVTLPSRLSTRMSRMFDNPETSSDVQFVVEQRTIHAHRIILSNSSDYFARMFSESRQTPEDSIVRVTIPDHSYKVFHAFLRFLYTDCLEVHFNLLPEMFKLANQHLVSDLQQICLSRMRITFGNRTVNSKHVLMRPRKRKKDGSP